MFWLEKKLSYRKDIRVSQIILQSVHNRLDFHYSLESSLHSSPRSAQALFPEASGNRAYVHN